MSMFDLDSVEMSAKQAVGKAEELSAQILRVVSVLRAQEVKLATHAQALDHRAKQLDEREDVVTKRETSVMSVRNELSAARLAKKIAEENVVKATAKVRAATVEAGELRGKLKKISAAFPGLLNA